MNNNEEDRRSIVEADEPELLKLLEDMKAKVSVVAEQIRPVVDRASNKQLPTSKGVSFLELKYQLLLQYCMNLSYYLLLKTTGESVKGHPVVDELIRIRTVLEKMRPLERKLKYQIDKLLKARSGSSGAADPLKLRANIADLAGSDDDDENGDGDSKGKKGGRANIADLAGDDDDEEEEADDGDEIEVTPQTVASGVYHAPKHREVFFEGDATADSKMRDQAARARQKAAKSALMSYIRDEYGDAPEEEKNVGEGLYEGVDDDDEEEKMRRAYEEDHFVRLSETRAQKQKMKNPKLIDELSNLGRLADLAKLRGEEFDSDEDEDAAAERASGAAALAENRPRTLSEAMHGISREALEAGRARAKWLGEPVVSSKASAAAAQRSRMQAMNSAVADDDDEELDSDDAYGPDAGEDDDDDDKLLMGGRGKRSSSSSSYKKQERGRASMPEIVLGKGSAKKAAKKQHEAEMSVFRAESSALNSKKRQRMTMKRGRYHEDGTRDRRPKKKPHH